MKISHHCNQLSGADSGAQVTLQGWVDRRRDHGGVIFIDLRDREGKTQIVFKPEHNAQTHQEAEVLRNEFVIRVSGEVRHRIEGMVNTKLSTGEIEIYADTLEILNTSQPPPIAVNEIADEAVENEDIRLKYRYLDLRRPRQQELIRKKSRFLHAWRNALHSRGFDEIETPILMNSTPEGARDFLVPSRLNPGKFYALPQSPQTYKQLLMIAGFERYYQVAKCFRDEDLRADRQPEFLQIDCEMSFIECEDIYSNFESMVAEVVGEIWGQAPKVPFRRLPYAECMLHYGIDKPDLRYGLKIYDVSTVAQGCSFNVFKQAIASGGVVRGLAADGCVDFTRKVIDDLTALVGKFGSKGLVWMRSREEGIETQLAKFFTEEELRQLKAAVKGQPGDMLFFVAGPQKTAETALGQLRIEIARLRNLTRGKPNEFLWVTDFPMFEYSQTEKRFMALHHPFTSPRNEDMPLLDGPDLGRIIAKAYDLVLNGVEIGGGSIRIHNSEIQKKVFNCLGLSDIEIQKKFGYFVEAFKFGAPPHGGIALGVDRFLGTLEGRSSIRDFIPFPKTSSGTALLEECPSSVELEQLRELHIRVADAE